MIKVLFVCMGNICRSPTGEGILKCLIQDKGLDDKFLVDSAGTIGYHAGSPADSRMTRAAAAKGYQLDSISRKVTPDDLYEFDLMIAMDRSNLEDLQRLKDQQSNDSACQLKLLSHYLGDQWPTDVPDPYYGSGDGFTYVVEMIEAACPGILAELESLE